MNLQIYKAEIDASLSSDLEVNYIGLVDRPAIERDFAAFKENELKVQFDINDEDRVIVGPAMIADLPIYRNDQKLGEYFVVFDPATIQTIVEKFSAKGFLKNFNLFHDAQQQVSDVTIFNSFITNKKYGINPPEKFKDVAEGSWFIAAKVNNEAVWQKIKSGEIKGFSVEGIFAYVPAKMQANKEADTWRKFVKHVGEENANELAKLLNETYPD